MTAYAEYLPWLIILVVLLFVLVTWPKLWAWMGMDED